MYKSYRSHFVIFMSTQRAANSNKEITKGDTWCTPGAKQMHQTRCTKPDASDGPDRMHPLPLCCWWPSDHAPTATLASPQAKIASEKQRENQKVHATLQPTLAPAKIVLEKHAIRKPCCKCTGIAFGASNVCQPWRFLPCLQILLTLSFHIISNTIILGNLSKTT